MWQRHLTCCVAAAGTKFNGTFQLSGQLPTSTSTQYSLSESIGAPIWTSWSELSAVIMNEAGAAPVRVLHHPKPCSPGGPGFHSSSLC